MEQDFESIKKQIKENVSKLIDNGNLEEAHSLLEEYLKKVSDDSEALSMKAVILMMNSKFSEAESILKSCLSIDADYFDFNYNLAYVYENLNKYDEAVFYYSKAFKLTDDKNMQNEINRTIDKIFENHDVNIDLNEQNKNKSEIIRKVLFIQSVPCIRTNKVAKALNSKGIQVDMLYLLLHPSQVYKDFKLPYKNIYQLIDINKAIDFINNSDYDILYSSNEPDYLTVLFSAANKPIVHDTHDMMSLRTDITNEQIILEYLANVKSSGNIYVNPDVMDIAVKKFNLKDKPMLSLHSYIEEEQLPAKYYEKLSKKDGQIHCVFEGGLQGTVGHHRYLEPIFLKLAENQIHVHLHCPVDQNYLKGLLKKSKYIHYEGLTSPQNLICEMTKYDIGLAIFNLTERNKTFLDTAFPNKIWDYLAAGLPIMFADLISFRNFSEESGVGRVLNLDGNIKQQFDDVMNIKIDKDILKKKKWIMNEAADEIIRFLEEVKRKYYQLNETEANNEDNKYGSVIENIRKTYDDFKNRKNNFETNYKNMLKTEISKEVNQNNFDKAILLIEEFEKYDNKDKDIFLYKTQILLQKGNIKEAKKVLEDNFDHNCTNPDYLYFMSYINGEEYNIVEATKYFAHAQMIEPSESDVTEIVPNFNKNINKKTNKILLGPSDIANQLNIYSKSLRKKGFETTNLSYYKKVFDFQIDKFIDILKYGDLQNQISKSKEIASEMISQNDVFHFIYGRSLALDGSDLPLYNKLNKKVVMSFMGDDVRQYSKAVKLNPYWKLIKEDYFGKLGLLDEEKPRRRIEFLSKYIEDCFVDYELYEYVKNDFKNIHCVRCAVDLNSIPFSAENKNVKPVIVHAPSSLSFKGTKFILKAIEELKEKYDFEFITVQNMKHDEAMKIYQKADIIVDQIIAGGYGIFSIEAMAMGKPVICWISDFMKNKYPKELPIVSANPDNVKEKIELLLKDPCMRKELGLRGRQYAEKYHDADNVVEDFIKVYNQ